MMAQQLIQFGSDVNWIIDKQRGHTLLMQLCAVKHEMGKSEKQLNIDSIKFLVNNGADKNIRNLKGKTAFDLAAKNSNCKIIREILVNE